MSEADQAQAIELKMWEQANASRPDPVRHAPGDPGYGPEWCDRCGDEMPEVRRQYGFSICVTCKTIEEKRLGF